MFGYHNLLLNVIIYRYMILTRYMVDDNRAIFMFRDGSQAWDAKDFLIEQERCQSVSIENKVYPGKFHPEVCCNRYFFFYINYNYHFPDRNLMCLKQRRKERKASPKKNYEKF
jgi:Chaperone for wingless signalling and trafficking of LDL receptor